MNLSKFILVGGAMCLTAGMAHAEAVVVVSAKSTLAALDTKEAANIFLGKSSTFPDGKQAVPLEQAEGSAAREDFHSKVTGKSSAQLKSFWSKQVFSGKGTPPKEVPGNADVKKLVADNPNMIGYIDKSALDASVKSILKP